MSKHSVNTYKTAGAFRIALEHRLREYSREHHIDLMRVRRQYTFDRFLARIFQSEEKNSFVLKGGYALELRINSARATKDIDLSVNFGSSESYDSASVKATLIEITNQNGIDFFEFHIGDPVMDLENAPYGGYRFPVNAMMAGRLFAGFHVDVAFGDTWFTPHYQLASQNWLEFAGIPAVVISVISADQQFAEKIHSYTLPRDVQNSRVKDIVDVILLIETNQIDEKRVSEAINKTFARRNTHLIPKELDSPPEFWIEKFNHLAEECKLNHTLDTAFEKIKNYWKMISNA